MKYIKKFEKINNFDEILKNTTDENLEYLMINKYFKEFFIFLKSYGYSEILENNKIYTYSTLAYKLMEDNNLFNSIDDILSNEYFFPVYVNFIKPYLEYKEMKNNMNKYNL